jgi:hypothetical protein
VRPRNRFWSHKKHGQLVHFVASSRIQIMGCYIQSSAGFGSACWRIQSAGGIAMFALLRQTGATRFRFGDPRKKIKKHSRRRWSQGAESGRKPAGFLHLHRQAAVCLVLRPLGWKRAKPQFKPAFCWNDAKCSASGRNIGPTSGFHLHTQLVNRPSHQAKQELILETS